MPYVNPIWLEGQRQRWLKPDWHRWVRHDAHRFAPPNPDEYKSYAARLVEQRRAEEQQTAVAEHEAFERALLDLRCEWKKLKLEYELHRIRHKYSPDQPRVPAGSAEGGQWTSGGGGGAGQHDGDVPQDGESLAQDLGSMRRPGPGQEPRRDLLDLDAIANHPPIRARIDEAWAASNPNGLAREHGFWISRSDATGELFTRPFANPGGLAAIVPGAPPSDAIAFFHTHPLRSEFGGGPSPSLEDSQFAARIGLPGLLQSHNGMYYFGPLLRPRRSP